MIGDQKTEHNVPHRTSCRVLGVSEVWFYKWRHRPSEPTKREVRRAELAEWIRYFFDRSGRTYGSPRITLDLWEEGWQVSQNTVAEIMAELGLQGRRPPRRRRSLTRPGKRKTAPDLVRRKFDAIAPDVLWWGYMTQIDTAEGKLYLASVHDAFSRRALGYAMGERHDAALVSAALQMAIATRGGQVDGVMGQLLFSRQVRSRHRLARRPTPWRPTGRDRIGSDPQLPTRQQPPRWCSQLLRGGRFWVSGLHSGPDDDFADVDADGLLDRVTDRGCDG
ncbi:IS3 family transposase [Streptomyces silvisoli]|uniref:IS3 family transposase n=1 Tax=Streptomyces silvisoli TaxID=3034235 RepID=A0ABT5ZT57_9ACTN|nr:IS3 family transposase [Streptomyces silvisoli]MDF3293008.1 IS3 family transposase [Streptomyces silvisoli]